jgi:hypothetical protein
MVVKTLLKRGIKKLTKKKPKTKPKTKPTPRYRTDPKTGERFLNRRATVSGKKGITKKETIDFRPAGYTAAGAGATYLGMKNKATKKRKETKAKLKEATDKIREKDKKKKEKLYRERRDNQRQK